MTIKLNRSGRPTRVALTALSSILLLVLQAITLISCKNNTFPKPIAYPRIEYPNANYQVATFIDKTISFEYPAYAQLISNIDSNRNWMNLRFGQFGATLHMSLTTVSTSEINHVLYEKEQLAFKQAALASDIKKEAFEATNNRFTGYFYLTDGNTPCPVQFILTNHRGTLFQGSLLFDQAMNRDSLESVVNGLTRDIRHLVETFQFN